jgi:hypothetical protein
MLNKLKSSLCLALFLTLFTTGCIPKKNYLEPKRMPPKDVKSAVVFTPSPVYREGKDLITIEAIDGQEPTFMDNRAIVSPGRHRFQMRIELHHDSRRTPDRSFVTRADTSIIIDIEAQKEYMIDAREDAEGLWVWATDLDTDEIVAGKPPKELRK